MLPANNPQVWSTTEVIDSVLPLREGKLPSKIYDLKGALLSLLEVGEWRKKKLAVPREAWEQDEVVERQLSELLTVYMRLVDTTVGQLGRENVANKTDRRTGTKQWMIDVSGTSVEGVNLRTFAEQQLQWLRRELALLDQGYAELDRWPGRERDNEISTVTLQVNEMRQEFVLALTDMLGRLINVDPASLPGKRNAIRSLVNLLQKYHGDWNDVLIVEGLAALRSWVAEKRLMRWIWGDQSWSAQDWYVGCRNLFAYTMNVLYAETEVANDEVTTTKRPCFTQFDRHHLHNRAVISDFDRFFYVQRDISGQVIDVYVQKKGLYTADSGNVYEYGITYAYPAVMWRQNPDFVNNPTAPLGNAQYFIIAYDALGRPIPQYTIDPADPQEVDNRPFETYREAVEDIVLDTCRAWEREREEARLQAKLREGDETE